MKFGNSTWYLKFIGVIVLITLLLFGLFFWLKYQQTITGWKKGSVNNTPKAGNSNISITTDQLILQTNYENDVLKYYGRVKLPSPCHKLQDQSLVMETYPENVQIRLVIEQSKADLICSQVITEKDFSGRIKVSPDALVSVYLNGKRIK